MALEQIMWLVAGCAGAYAIGCFSTAYYLVRLLRGSDIRDLETGTAGARNAGRVLGRKAGMAVALADIAKGAAAVWLGALIAGSSPLSPLLAAAAVAGHIWPAQLGFRGGKGLATGFGALLWLFPFAAVVAAGVNLILSLAARSATFGTLIATALFPALAYATGVEFPTALLLAIPCALVIFAHRRNIRAAMARRTGEVGPP